MKNNTLHKKHQSLFSDKEIISDIIYKTNNLSMKNKSGNNSLNSTMLHKNYSCNSNLFSPNHKLRNKKLIIQNELKLPALTYHKNTRAPFFGRINININKKIKNLISTHKEVYNYDNGLEFSLLTEKSIDKKNCPQKNSINVIDEEQSIMNLIKQSKQDKNNDEIVFPEEYEILNKLHRKVKEKKLEEDLRYKNIKDDKNKLNYKYISESKYYTKFANLYMELNSEVFNYNHKLCYPDMIMDSQLMAKVYNHNLKKLKNFSNKYSN